MSQGIDLIGAVRSVDALLLTLTVLIGVLAVLYGMATTDTVYILLGFLAAGYGYLRVTVGPRPQRPPAATGEE